MDRRAAFFVGAAVISALLIPVTEAAQRWVPIALAVVYVLLAIASWADRRTKLRTVTSRSVPPRAAGHAPARRHVREEG